MISKLRKEMNAIIFAHYYQIPEIQDIANFVGDSLDLSKKSAETDSDIIVFAGVNFMAETAKILSPDKKVLLPDLEAGCSLADSCPYNEFKAFKDKHPDHVVVSYVNTTAAIKTLTDITCTSTNAVEVIESIPKDIKIIFAPDRNLGNYLNRITGRDMLVWDGACNDCKFMKFHTVEKIYNSLNSEQFEIHLEKEVIEKAKLPILKMLDIF